MSGDAGELRDALGAPGGMSAEEPLSPKLLGELLDMAAGMLDRYVVLPSEAEQVALALFVAHTYAFEGAHATPYLLVVSPEKRSGKTRLLEVVELLVARPWRVIGASEAALFRKIEKHRPTMLLDELDAVFGSHTERTEPLRAALNGGNRPGAAVSRCIGEGRNVEDYSVFCPKVLAGIDSGHRIPDTIRDRAVTLHMQRKTASEHVERLRVRHADIEAEPIREGFRGWAVGDAPGLLLEADPVIPPELDDRAAEAWEPLLAIADMAGGNWPDKARAAAAALSGVENYDEVATGPLLLAAIREAFGAHDRMTTAELLKKINADDELPFGGRRDGKGLDGRHLAELLKSYQVRPRTIWLDGDNSAKGYRREQFTEAWTRWLQPSETSEASGDAKPVSAKSHEQANLTDLTDLTDTAGADGADTNDDRKRDSEPQPATDAEEAEVERIAAKFGGL